jgi:hypothetical protein
MRQPERSGAVEAAAPPAAILADVARSQPHPLNHGIERKLAVDLYNEVWRLMELPARTPEQTDSMIHAAHASRHHWAQVGAHVNLARGEWLCSRVYWVLGRPEPAIWHARRCLELLEAVQDAEDWDLPAAYEGLARAYGAAGKEVEAGRWAALGRESAAAISDPEDREQIEKDLRALGQGRPGIGAP